MAGPENPYSILHPHTRQGKLPGGHKRALPGIIAYAHESRPIYLNATLNPDATEEELRQYLGVSGPKPQGYSRNFR